MMNIFCKLTLFSTLLNSVISEWNTKDFLRREHSLIKPYQSTGMTVPNWDFLGSTIVTSNYVRLTPDQQSKQGALWNSIPCNVRNWELQVQFKVHGKGKELFGDGFAIWYVKDRMKPGPIFGSPDNFYGLAVIADTYSNHNGEHNHNHPYISAMVNNGTLHYDHDRDGTHTQLNGCEVKFRNFEHETYIAVKYSHDILKVFTDVDGQAAWKECFSVEGVRLPTGYYFGMSAATGDLSDNHDIVGVRFYELESPDPNDTEDRSIISPAAISFEPPREHVPDEKPAMSGVKLFIILLLSAVALIVLVICGVIFYQKQRDNRRKRFY